MIDSINFLPSALSELPRMFGFEELKKGYFPHLFNMKENQSVVLNHLPDVHYYVISIHFIRSNFRFPTVSSMLYANSFVVDKYLIHCMALMECFSSWRILELEWYWWLNHLPDVHYYNSDAMKLKDRKAFFIWYETNYRQRLDIHVLGTIGYNSWFHTILVQIL
jgi:hypothetical protein